MNELIKITEQENGKQAVSARELYIWLTEDTEFKHFNRWAKKNITDNEYAIPYLADNQSIPHDGGNFDYQRLTLKDSNGRAIDDFALIVPKLKTAA